MTGTTIAVTAEVAAHFHAVKRHYNEHFNSKLSSSRMLGYLCHLFDMMLVAGGQVEAAEQRAVAAGTSVAAAREEAWRDAWHAAMWWTPPRIPMGVSQEFWKSTPEQRLEVAAQLRRRLGIEPTDDLVRAVINAGGRDPIRNLVLVKMDGGEEVSAHLKKLMGKS